MQILVFLVPILSMDALGNMLTRIRSGSGAAGNHGYGYDGLKRLASVKTGAGYTYYAYNALQQRVSKKGVGGTVAYLHGPGGQLLAETPANGAAMTTQYVWLGGVPVAMVRNDTVYHIHTDQLGRPEAVTNATRAIVWRASNTPYDRTVTQDTIGGLNLGLPGQYYDAESGLWHNWHRYYDARLGRYITSDPIGLDGGLNTYGYVGGNPTASIDPSGLNPVAGAIEGAQGGLWIGTAACGPYCGAVGAVAGAGVGAWLGWQAADALMSQSNNDDGAPDGSEAKPDNCPAGTVPIDKAKKKFGLSSQDVHGIKAGNGAGPKTWTGIAPNGDVWVGGIGGTGTNGGHYTDYTNGGGRRGG